MNNTTLLALAISSTFSLNAFSAETSRFSGEIFLLGGFSSTNSNLSTENNARLNNLNGSGETQDEFIAVPLGNLAYDLGQQRNQRIYLGTSRDDLAVGDLAFELGYQYDFANGTQIDIAFLPTVLSGEVWANPYDTDNARSETDVDGYAYRVKLNQIMGSGFSLDLAVGKNEIDNEQIEYRSLHRDADVYFAKASYAFQIGQSSALVPAFSYTENDAVGAAASYERYETELTYYMVHNAHSLALTAGFGKTEYDAVNPIFDKTRKDDHYKLFVAYEYANVMGWENWNFVSLSGLNTTSSNIDFYESDEYVVTAGLSYKF
ncbi:DUF2860 domain-containing protein [Agarivorans albus]|uniref:DUF2860 domain-containing protein n=1 Tax=Agarivorans albus MKT 106 TaxID=1331007 RepID=R9PJV3_AGAAL|nr:DUF2860 domain-containing protein [Agarivorans albus]GAD01664.1 hypothetical protein AALB_1744 [Agarivorans albus MKT 106]